MRILVLKTSSDTTIQRLFKELGDTADISIDCLIQSSQVSKYKLAYPYINFIDIYKERFENLPNELTDKVLKNKYDCLYVTLTGENGYNFWNVIELIGMVRFKEAFFYNCNGEKMKIPKRSIMRDKLCELLIRWIELVY